MNYSLVLSTFWLTLASFVVLRAAYLYSDLTSGRAVLPLFMAALLTASAHGAWVFLMDRIFWEILLLYVTWWHKGALLASVVAAVLACLGCWMKSPTGGLARFLWLLAAYFYWLAAVGTATHVIWFYFSEV